jgi:hypothetical protein
MGTTKLNVVIIAILTHTIPKYTLENLRARRYAQIEYFRNEVASMLRI